MCALSLERHSAGMAGPMTEFFRQQAALDPSLQWNVLHPAASTLFSIPPNAGHVLQYVPVLSALFAVKWTTQQRCIIPTQHQPCNRPDQVESVQQLPHHSLCISWNCKRSLYPSSCSFRHVCSLCFQHHLAVTSQA